MSSDAHIWHGDADEYITMTWLADCLTHLISPLKQKHYFRFTVVLSKVPCWKLLCDLGAGLQGHMQIFITIVYREIHISSRKQFPLRQKFLIVTAPSTCCNTRSGIITGRLTLINVPHISSKSDTCYIIPVILHIHTVCQNNSAVILAAVRK